MMSALPAHKAPKPNSWPSPSLSREWMADLAAPELVESWMDQPTFGVLLVDRKGIIRRANETLLDWVGKSYSETIMAPLATIFHKTDFISLWDGLQKSFHGERCIKQSYPASLFPLQQIEKVCINHYPVYSVDNQTIAGVLLCFDTLPIERPPQEPLDVSQQILDNLDEYLVLVDREMRLLSANQRFMDSFGERFSFPLERGTSFIELFPNELRERYYRPFIKALQGETIATEIKLDDSWWEIKYVPVYQEEKVIAVVISASNIDDWVKMRAEFDLLTQELMRSNAELKQFAYITSHNLRAPVVNLVSLLGFVDRKQVGDEMNQQIFHKIDSSAVRLESTLQDLVQVVAIKDRRDITFSRVNFRQLLDELLETMAYELIDSKAMIQADFTAVREVIYPRNYLWSICQNLLGNAMKYRRPGIKPNIKISSFREAGSIGIQIEDNGLGMDLETYGDRLFGLYQRFHEGEGLNGKGLGLYIVKSQVESLQGKISVSSTLNQGSVFRVYLRNLLPL
ncbi:MAG: ATP-binding protein [Bacteroidota bacterium]